MIFKTYLRSRVNATYDPYFIYNSLIKYYPDIEYYHPFNEDFVGVPNSKDLDPLDGIRINNLFSGIILSGLDNINNELKLEVHVELFHERTILIEFEFETDSIDDYLVFCRDVSTGQYTYQKKLEMKVDDKIKEISLGGIVNDFMMDKLFNVNSPELKSLLENLDSTDVSFAEKYKKDLKNIVGLDPDIIGQGLGLNFSGNFGGVCIAFDDKQFFSIDNSWEKVSIKNDIYHSEELSTYLVKDKKIFDKFLKDIKLHMIRKNIISGYMLTTDRWFYTIRKESDDIMVNLDNPNSMYWKKLRLLVEKMQLQFLSQHAQRSAVILKGSNVEYQTINKETNKKWTEEIDKRKNNMDENVRHVQYSLENLATPGHTHDEQALQKETEKTNESILLLSFLAMSIPMLVAITSPAFSLATKLMSAMILLLLPIGYFLTYRISKYRKSRLDNKRDFMRQKEALKRGLKDQEIGLNQLKENSKISEDLKKGATKVMESNVTILTNMIKKIDGKLK